MQHFCAVLHSQNMHCLSRYWVRPAHNGATVSITAVAPNYTSHIPMRNEERSQQLYEITLTP